MAGPIGLAATAGLLLAAGLAADSRTGLLLGNTLLMAAGTVAASVPAGTLLGWLLMRTDLPGRRLGLLVLAVMLFVPLYLQAAAWQAGFGLGGWATLAGAMPPWLDGWTGAIWVHGLAAIPWVALIVGVGFLLVEAELEEQALVEGPPARVFFHVSLPGAWPAVGVATVWVALTAAGEMTVTDLFMIRTYAEELYTRRAAMGLGPLEALRGMVWQLLALAWLAAAGLALWVKLVPGERPLSLAHRPLVRLGRWRPLAAVSVHGALVLLAGLPLGSLVYKAGVVVIEAGGGWLRSWSVAKCLAMVVASPWEHAREFGWSVLISAAAATTAAAGGAVLAWAARGGRW
ncbi:MAG TPA: hypothetical protein EYH34_10980, partial [Planctomycetes bacterium]|nr:hypothetical protein [Planctomycetota bacterium]